MKLTKHFCDFCGNEIKKGQPFACLSVPNTMIAERVDPTKRPKAKKRSDVEGVSEYFIVRMPWGMSDQKADETDYDVCAGCVRSFLIARFAALESARKVMTAAGAELESVPFGALDEQEA